MSTRLTQNFAQVITADTPNAIPTVARVTQNFAQVVWSRPVDAIPIVAAITQLYAQVVTSKPYKDYSSRKFVTMLTSTVEQ